MYKKKKKIYYTVQMKNRNKIELNSLFLLYNMSVFLCMNIYSSTNYLKHCETYTTFFK